MDNHVSKDQPTSIASTRSLDVSTTAQQQDSSTISPAFLLGTLRREFSIEDAEDNSVLTSTDSNNHLALQAVGCKCRDSLSPNAYCVD